ncbi:hypothetical protein CKY10_14790 [Photorhabdus sp. HUG-39]|uniref:Tail fiber protein n=1 Tax=Photorhabdus kayaii TaxID=230088 RepID=A0ABX0B0B3_9GAMM|nr:MULTISPECIES: phage tail protein [Photorhabdus]MCC8374053.1 tail fiber protein [Photorhabdus bodei]MDB6370350.1 phage tail protein [Photorhabdus bodei]NDL13015.1 tail fiber protein [Photorhabdus kayaii]NDL26543.1 tail fiber protein [Photorhabdus kayaii]RAX08537.1 hypothetical protein CKY10_14790 [Photorhabdus sp. HUG-39]
MEKKHNLSTSQSNTENTNPKSIGPSADELKNRFKEGSIPLQTDYSDLIDIADIGRRAVGKAPDQTDNPNSGLELDNNHGLSVKTNPTGGISVDSSGIAVKCWPSGGITVTDGSGLYLKLAGGNTGNGWSGVSGLSLGSDGVKIKANNGINVDGSGVAVKVKDKSLLTDAGGLAVNTGRGLWINNDKLEVDNHDGIEIVNEGVKVKAGNGINVDSNGVAVKAKDNTINVESTGISVRLGWGIKIGDGLDVKASNGIHVDSNGVSVKAKAGNGIKVDSDGVSIDIQSIASALADLIIPPGTIVPFYGNYNSPPSGWVWCDGSNGTPDLNTNSNHHDSVDYINLISGGGDKRTNYWQLDYGTHVAANIYFMRYIMKK